MIAGSASVISDCELQILDAEDSHNPTSTRFAQHGEETYPHECCGVLLGRMEDDERQVVTSVRCGNTRADSPQNRYNIDPRELVRIQRQGRERGEDIVGFYHSHPDHPARWSQTDLAEAHWFGCSYVITSVEKGKRGDDQLVRLLGTAKRTSASKTSRLRWRARRCWCGSLSTSNRLVARVRLGAESASS